MLQRLIRGAVRVSKTNGAKASRSLDAASATTKYVSGSVANAAASELLETEYREEPPRGIEARLFKQLPRPRLTEGAAADLTLEQAKLHAQQAQNFYRFGFALFTRPSLFYEEVEESFLKSALGYDDDNIDRRFLDVATLFRETLNANTRGLHVIWMPAIFVLVFALATLSIFAGSLPLVGNLQEDPVLGTGLFLSASVLAFIVLYLAYSWPYKFVQQRNLMNLDNYITSKFSRINNNFQVAKRQALNVERDKRIPEKVALKEDAGDWTLAYQWFAMRLFLCELALRNQFYQVRRNTSLYWFAGVIVVSVLYLSGLIALYMTTNMQLTAGYAAAGALYIFASALALRTAPRVMFNVVESNEWARFSQIDLDETIRDHVGEDKLQIVTFRDRNRME